MDINCQVPYVTVDLFRLENKEEVVDSLCARVDARLVNFPGQIAWQDPSH